MKRTPAHRQLARLKRDIFLLKFTLGSIICLGGFLAIVGATQESHILKTRQILITNARGTSMIDLSVDQETGLPRLVMYSPGLSPQIILGAMRDKKGKGTTSVLSFTSEKGHHVAVLSSVPSLQLTDPEGRTHAEYNSGSITLDQDNRPFWIAPSVPASATPAIPVP